MPFILDKQIAEILFWMQNVYGVKMLAVSWTQDQTESKSSTKADATN